ncbi:MAG TPA: universal stress protein, partial [Planctomycetaceae bacterium]
TGLLRTLMGSVAEQVLRRAPVPVFLLRSSDAAPAVPPDFSRILVPLDGSPLAQTALQQARLLARQFGSELILVEVLPTPEAAVDVEDGYRLTADEEAAIYRERASDYLRRVHDELAADGFKTKLAVRVGKAAEQIVSVAEAVRAGAIVLTTHGRTGLDRVRHGSVAEDVIRRSPVPVMTLGQAALQRHQDTAPA